MNIGDKTVRRQDYLQSFYWGREKFRGRAALKNNVLSLVLGRLSRQLEVWDWLSGEWSVWRVDVNVGVICLQGRGNWKWMKWPWQRMRRMGERGGAGHEILEPTDFPELLSFGVCVLGLFCKYSLKAFS